MPGLFDIKDLLRRHLIILGLSLLFCILGAFNANDSGLLGIQFWRGVIWTFLYIATMWNGNLAIITLSSYGKLSWETQARRKIIFGVAVAIIWPVLVNFLFNDFIFPWIMQQPCGLTGKDYYLYLIISVSITLLVNAVMQAIEFFSFWRKSMIEKESLKRNTITAEFESLKNQVNPHFLFNSLNTLSGLIDENPESASRFVQKLSGVYRYLLSQKDKELVSLGEELDFAESYIYLNRMRFGENLNVSVNIDENLLGRGVVTLALQILLENAIKHNVISKQRPLSVKIFTEGEYLCVVNNLQPKSVLTTGNGIGLVNIDARYRLIGNVSVKITQTENEFSVCLPLLNVVYENSTDRR